MAESLGQLHNWQGPRLLLACCFTSLNMWSHWCLSSSILPIFRIAASRKQEGREEGDALSLWRYFPEVVCTPATYFPLART